MKDHIYYSLTEEDQIVYALMGERLFLDHKIQTNAMLLDEMDLKIRKILTLLDRKEKESVAA